MSTSLVYLSLILGVVGTIVTIIMSARALFGMWKNKTIEEAENTKAIKDNTAAVLKLTALYGTLEDRVEALERMKNALQGRGT